MRVKETSRHGRSQIFATQFSAGFSSGGTSRARLTRDSSSRPKCDVVLHKHGEQAESETTVCVVALQDTTWQNVRALHVLSARASADHPSVCSVRSVRQLWLV